MNEILVVGRHPLDNAQIAELEEVFGDIVVCTESGFVRSVDSIINDVRMGSYRAVVTMLPLNMVAQMTTRGVCPIRSIRPNAVHSGFDVVTDVVVTSVPLAQAVRDGVI